ncbi:MAG: hypothetical protein CMD14_03370 [Flavobacteriales bacterium]|nr:hypothetical protein [Flavobacteriales bacterium]|tara:strand:- start:8072 stop:8566 length:495 start_codon:yes stop_codon:yes gene_type:complete
MNYNKNNIDRFGPNKTAVFTLSDKIPIDHTVSFRDALTKDVYNTKNTLYDLFFSDKNMELIQHNIINGVKKMSNNQYVINNQSKEQLKIIMNSIYVQHSRSVNGNIDQIIHALNKLVIQYSVPQIFNEIESNMKYKRDINSLIMPMSNPILLKNDKQLKQHVWF